MNIILGLLIVAAVYAITWLLANMIILQSEIDKIDAIGRWIKEELERIEAESEEEDGEEI